MDSGRGDYDINVTLAKFERMRVNLKQPDYIMGGIGMHAEDHRVKVTMTEKQVKIVADLLWLAKRLGEGSAEHIWDYLPLRLSYSSFDPEQAVRKAKKNIGGIEKISRNILMLQMDGDNALGENRLSRKQAIMDMHNDFSDHVFAGVPDLSGGTLSCFAAQRFSKDPAVKFENEAPQK